MKDLSYHLNPLISSEKLFLIYSSRYPVGTHVLDKEWDILIVLDTCRVDAMQVVVENYNFLSSTQSTWSIAGSSQDWIAHTFDKKYNDVLEDTIYLTANPHAETVLEEREYIPEKHGRGVKKFYKYGSWNPVKPNEIQELKHLWKYESKNEIGKKGHRDGYTPPQYVTDQAIKMGREEDFERLILHYMQPHSPWVSKAIEENRELYSHEKHPSHVKKDGRERVFSAYLDELRYVLDSVELLLDNIDAPSVVITADHGEAFGEYGVVGHDPGRFHPKVRKVPWVRTSATDKREYEPEMNFSLSTSVSTEDQLKALGYK